VKYFATVWSNYHSNHSQELFNEGFQSDRDRALFGVCLYTACRINEGCTLNTQDVYDKRMRVRGEIIFRRHNTKGKLAARAVPVIQELRELLVIAHL